MWSTAGINTHSVRDSHLSFTLCSEKISCAIFTCSTKFQDFFFKFSNQKHDSKSHYKVFQCKIDNNDQLLYENIPILFFLSTSLNVLIFTVNFNIYIVDYFSLNLSLPVTIESWYSNFFSLLSKLPLISIIFYWNILKICCSKIFFFFSPNKCQYYPNKWKKNYEFHYSN